MNFTSVSDATLFGKAVRLPLRLMPRAARMPILQGPMRGMWWITGAAQHGCWLGSYEVANQQAFQALIRPGDVVYDLGANVGFYSLLASKLVGPDGHVHSFEPSPRNLDYLRRHLKINRVANCTVWAGAIGGNDGMGSFDFGSDPVSGHLSARKGGGQIDVRIYTLDKLIERNRVAPPNFIKCDIEGAEYDALMAARTMLIKARPKMILSTHGERVHQQCFALLSGLGYHLSELHDPAAQERPSMRQDRQILAVPI